MFQKFNMLECKHRRRQMPKHEEKKLNDETTYRQLVGSLICLTLTRPDISYAVGVMSRYVRRTKKPQFDATRRIFR